MPSQSGLFTPVRVGPLELPNRIVMSPMTRIRADYGCVPSERMVRYYAQRASAGLIITEGTHPSPMGRGYTFPPGLHSKEQASGWRKVTDAVHAAGGLCAVRGADRVGIKIGPGFTVNDTFDDDPAETYTYLAERLNRFDLAYLHVGYDSGYGRGAAPPFNAIDLIRRVYTGTFLAVRAEQTSSSLAGRTSPTVGNRTFSNDGDYAAFLKATANHWPPGRTWIC